MHSLRVWVLAHAELDTAVFHCPFSLVPLVGIFPLTFCTRKCTMFANILSRCIFLRGVASYGRSHEEYQMPEKPQKPEKTSQGQTLSLRISDALYARLERVKQLM